MSRLLLDLQGESCRLDIWVFGIHKIWPGTTAMERHTTVAGATCTETPELLMPSTTTSVSGWSGWTMDTLSRSASSPLTWVEWALFQSLFDYLVIPILSFITYSSFTKFHILFRWIAATNLRCMKVRTEVEARSENTATTTHLASSPPRQGRNQSCSWLSFLFPARSTSTGITQDPTSSRPHGRKLQVRDTF